MIKNIKSKILNLKSLERQGGFTPHLLCVIKERTLIHRKGAGFTLIELIIYLGIVGMILVSISYLILDIMVGQATNYADQEVNYNFRYIADILTDDIKSSQDIGSLTNSNLVLIMAGDDIIYNFDETNKILSRQVGDAAPLSVNNENIEIIGNFTDFSKMGRTKNVGIHLNISYKNPGNISDYNSTTTVDFAVELRGRR